MANARDLIANYDTYTSARELNHSVAADAVGRTSPACISTVVSNDVSFELTC